MTYLVDSIAALWRFPLALLSFAFYRYMRFWMRYGMARHFARHPEEALAWRVLSAESIARPWALPAVLTSGPRWNTHAIIATVGPFDVVATIEFDREAASRSAGAWTIVAYRWPRSRTEASIGSRDAGSEFRLAPGRYALALRYYRWSELPALPAVRVDGREVVASVPVDREVNRFYDRLGERRKAAFAAMHYYV